MTELARDARRAPLQPTPEHQSRPHPGGDLDVDHVLDADPDAVAALGQRAEVRVVVDFNSQLEPTLELCLGTQPGPAGQDHRRADAVLLLIDWTRQAEPDAEDVAAVDACLLHGCRDQVGRCVERFVRRAIDVEFPGTFRQHS